MCVWAYANRLFLTPTAFARSRYGGSAVPKTVTSSPGPVTAFHTVSPVFPSTSSALVSPPSASRSKSFTESSTANGPITSQSRTSPFGTSGASPCSLPFGGAAEARIVADGNLLGQSGSKFRQRNADLRAVHDDHQPRRFAAGEVVKPVHPRPGEALRQHPHRRLRVEGLEVGGLLLQKVEQYLRARAPGSPPGTNTASIRGSDLKSAAHSLSANSTVFESA